MVRTVYLNGQYMPETEAKISVFDRGFMFSDSVYEVTCVANGKLVDFERHMVRLQRSLRALGFAHALNNKDDNKPDFLQEYRTIHCELVERNHLQRGTIYVQITRGVAPDRSFCYPDDLPPTILMLTQEETKPNLATTPPGPESSLGLRVITIPDHRWGRCDIKTTQLLYQSMGKMQAKAAGVQDAWMVDTHTGFITEGTSSNVWIVKNNRVFTPGGGGGGGQHPGANKEILHGITRTLVTRLLQEHFSIVVAERCITVAEAQEADEAFSTSSSSDFVRPVVEIDGTPIASGKPGPMTRRLRELCMQESRNAPAPFV